MFINVIMHVLVKVGSSNREKNATIIHSIRGYAEAGISALTFAENSLGIFTHKQHHLVHTII
jgi:hypothetical protein